jgi:hypothetical protein
MKNLCLLAVILAQASVTSALGAESVEETVENVALEVTDFGAIGDGQSDDTKAFQDALKNAAARGGGVVVAPIGSFRIATHLEIPSGVCLQGQWQAPHHSRMPKGATGSLLLAEEGKGSESGPPFILLHENAAIRGFTIFYPEQTIDSVSPYPFTIEGNGRGTMHATAENVTLVNSYNGIAFRKHHELHHVRNVYGVCLRRGIQIDNCTDIGRIENVHFNPHYWIRSSWPNAPVGEKRQALLNYVNANGEAFIFGRTDWEYVFNTFCYGYKIGYRFVDGETGAMNGNLVGIGSDGSNVAVQVDAANPFGILITNGEFVSMFGDHPVEVVTGSGFKGVLQLNNCSFWGPTYACAELRGPGTVSFNQCNFVHWNQDSPAILVERGSVTIASSRFQLAQKHVRLGKNVKSAIVMGNTFTGPMDLLNESQGRVQTGLNVDEIR